MDEIATTPPSAAGLAVLVWRARSRVIDSASSRPASEWVTLSMNRWGSRHHRAKMKFLKRNGLTKQRPPPILEPATGAARRPPDTTATDSDAGSPGGPGWTAGRTSARAWTWIWLQVTPESHDIVTRISSATNDRVPRSHPCTPGHRFAASSSRRSSVSPYRSPRRPQASHSTALRNSRRVLGGSRSRPPT